MAMAAIASLCWALREHRSEHRLQGRLLIASQKPHQLPAISPRMTFLTAGAQARTGRLKPRAIIRAVASNAKAYIHWQVKWVCSDEGLPNKQPACPWLP